MTRRLILALAAAVVLAPLSLAQMRAQMRGEGFRLAPRSAPGYGAPFSGRHGSRSAFARGYYLGAIPYFYDAYPYEAAVAEPPPQVIVVETPAVADEPPAAKPAPLLIVLQGDRYVRYGGVGQSRQPDAPGHEIPERQPPSRRTPASRMAASPDSAQLAPTVLVYRDGHREEIPDYAIVGSVIYARSNDGQTGYAMKNIQLSALDIPTTMRANRDRGGNFVLPSGPNEVVTRP